MKLIKTLLLLLLIGLLACETNTTNNTETHQQTDVKPNSSAPSTIVPGAEIDSTTKASSLVEDGVDQYSAQSKVNNCKAKGKMMEENDLWIKDQDIWVGISTDSISEAYLDFGESYRIFDMYDTKTCELASRHLLPVNRSPDFPYYIFKETYESQNKVVCTSGFEYTFCCDVVNKKMLPKMEPTYFKERVGEDAQSGLPLGLKVWDHFLFGYAQDLGAYAFDIENKTKPKALRGVAEFTMQDEMFEYNTLFLVQQDSDTYQGIIPSMNEDEDAMELQVLFKKPLKINPSLSDGARNNRYLIFKDLSAPAEKRVVIDMQAATEIKLPKGIASKKSGEILQWLKKR